MSEFYPCLKEEFENSDAHNLLTSVKDIGIVTYFVDKTTFYYDFANWLDENNISRDVVKGIIIILENAEESKGVRKMLRELFPNTYISIFFGMKGYRKVMRENFIMAHSLVLHLIGDYDEINSFIPLRLSNKRYLYDIIISVENDWSLFFRPYSIKTINKDLCTLHFNNKEPIPLNDTEFCKERLISIDKLLSKEQYHDAFFQSMEEVNNGCDSCPKCSMYSAVKVCPVFQHIIAGFYRKGLFVPKNEKIAHHWDEMSAKQGYKDAILSVAEDLANGFGCEKDKESSISYFTKFASIGDRDCAKKIIEIAKADNCEISYKALPWISRLANDNDTDSMFELVKGYQMGIYGLPIDAQQQEEWALRAAENGDIDSIKRLASFFDDCADWNKALIWYGKLRDITGDESIDEKLDDLNRNIIKYQGLTSYEIYKKGYDFLNGYGVRDDYHLAYLYFQIAAEMDDALGYHGLACCYWEGKGVEKDVEKGNEYERKSADKGYSAAIKWMYENDDCDDEMINKAIQSMESGLQKRIVPEILSLANSYNYGDFHGIDEPKAVNLYLQAVSLGDIESLYELAKCYENGWGAEVDSKKSAEYYKSAAEKGHLISQYELALRYKDGDGLSKNLSEAFTWFKKAAERGHVEAQYELAECYFRGRGVNTNKQVANNWYIKAAEQDNLKAQAQLSENYYYGYGIEINYPEAKKWSVLAADRGCEGAFFRAAYLCSDLEAGEPDYAKSKKWFEILANKGNSGAMNNLGWMYEYGYAVDVDLKKAFEWYLKAAEAGDEVAQKNIGYNYEYGKGADINYEKAKYWYEKSSENGYSLGTFCLGNLYYKGKGVKKDLDKAIALFEKAVSMGNSTYLVKRGYKDAVMKLGDIFLKEVENAPDYQKAFEYYHKGADEGVPRAYYLLGQFYDKGYYVERNTNTAVFWYKKAAQKGHRISQIILRDKGISWIEEEKDK